MQRLARIVLSLLFISLVCGFAGCGTDHYIHQLQKAQQAYTQQDYAKTKRLAVGVASANNPNLSTQGHYLAGVSSRRLGQNQEAHRYLKAATRSTDRSLAGDAWAELGFMYNHQDQFRQAARAFIAAAQYLGGQDRSNAYFQAGIAQQKLGFWPAARSSLTLARGYNKDAAMGTQIQDYLNTVGFTLQVGAYRSQANAQKRIQEVANRTQHLPMGLPKISSIYSGQGTYYRVHVGRFTDYPSAASARKLMAYEDALIVPLSQNQ